MTGNKRTNLYSRRNLSLSMLSTYMYNDLRQQILDLAKALYGSRGVFSGGTFTFGGSDVVNIAAIEALDNDGHLINLEAHSNIAFPNVAGTTYYVGYRYVEVEVPETPVNAIEISPFAGTYNYRFYEENVGEIGSPDQVIDNSGTLTLVIDGVVGTTSAAGRTAKVWLTTPISGNQGWYEDLTIYYGTNPSWSGNKNYVTTTGDFHQQALSGSVSTTTSDYRVWMHGVTITTTDITSNTNYIFLGTITGDGPHAIPVSYDQSGITYLPISVQSYNIYLNQLAKDYYGDNYQFGGLNARSDKGEGPLATNDATPDISNYRTWATTNTSATTITNLDGGKRGDIRTIACHDDFTTLQSVVVVGNPGLYLKDLSDWTLTYGDNITLLYAGSSKWWELGRTEHTGGFTSTSSTSSSSSSTSTFSSTSSSSSSSTSSSVSTSTSSSSSSSSTSSSSSSSSSSCSTSSSSSTSSTSPV